MTPQTPSQRYAAEVSDLMRAIGQRIRALRTLHEMTQADLAAVAGLSRASIANIEGGNQGIQIDALVAVARHFGCPVAALLGEANSPVLPKVTIAKVCAVDCDECGPVASRLTSAEATTERRRHVQAHLTGEIAAVGR